MKRIFKIALLTFGLIGLAGTLILFFGAEAISNAIEVSEAMLSLQVLSPSITFVTIASVLRGYFNGLDKVLIEVDGGVNAETGKATLTGQGFTSASVRIENEEIIGLVRESKLDIEGLSRLLARNEKHFVNYNDTEESTNGQN